MKLKTSRYLSLFALALALVAAILPGGLNRVAAAVSPEPPSLLKNAGILDLDLRVLVAGKPLYLILVEKDKQRLRVLKHDGRLKVLAEYVSATGANLGPKVVEGDSKTPEGIYFISKIYTDNKISVFGSRAFHLDYPNVFDEESGRSGKGIFIHGTNKELRLNSSNGCITLKNADLDELAGFLNIETTPVIIVASLDELSQGKNLEFIDPGFEMAKAMLVPNEIDRRKVTFDSLYLLNFRGQTVAAGEFQANKDGNPPQRGVSRSYLAYSEKKGWAVKKQLWHPLTAATTPTTPLAGTAPNVTMAPVTVGVTAFADHWAKLWQWPEIEAYAGIFERYLDAQAKLTLHEPSPSAPKIGPELGGWRLLAMALLSLGISLASAGWFMQGKAKKIPLGERREALEELFQERGRQINAFQAEISGLSYELNLLQSRVQDHGPEPSAAQLQALEELLARKEEELTALAASEEGNEERERQLARLEAELAQTRAEREALSEGRAEERQAALARVSEREETISNLHAQLEQLRAESRAKESGVTRIQELEARLSAKEEELAQREAEAIARQEGDEAEALHRAAFESEQQELLLSQQAELELLHQQLAERQEEQRRHEHTAARLLEAEALLTVKSGHLAKQEEAMTRHQEEDAAEARRRAAFEAGQQKLLTTQQAELELLRRDREEAQHSLRQHGQTVSRVLEMEELLQARNNSLATLEAELAELGAKLETEQISRQEAAAAAARQQSEREVREEELRSKLAGELAELRARLETELIAKDELRAGLEAELASQREAEAAASRQRADCEQEEQELRAMLEAELAELQAKLEKEQTSRQEAERAAASRLAELETLLAELETEKLNRPEPEVEAGQVEMLANLETELARLRDKEKEAAENRRRQEETATRLQELEAQLAEEQKMVAQLNGEYERAKYQAEELTAMNEERKIIQEEVEALQEQLREERKKLRLAEEKNIRIPELLQLLENMKLEVESLVAENRSLHETRPIALEPATPQLEAELAGSARRLSELEEELAEKEGEISQLLVKNSALKAKAVMAGGIAAADSAAEELGRLRQELASARESKLTPADLAGQTEELERLLALKNDEIEALGRELAEAGPAAGASEELTALQAELAAERAARLAAEAAALRISELESLLAAREAEIDELTAPQPQVAAATALAAEEQQKRLDEMARLLTDKDAQLAELTRSLEEQRQAAAIQPPPEASESSEGMAALQAELAALQGKVAKQEEEIKKMQTFSDEGAVLVKGSHYIPGAVLRAWTKS